MLTSTLLSRYQTTFASYFVLAPPDTRAKVVACLKLLLNTIPELRSKVGLMFSYAYCRQDLHLCSTEESKQYVEMLKEAGSQGINVILDSGAFHILARKIPLERFQRYINDYIKFCDTVADYVQHYVIPDVPCDTRPATEVQKMPNLEKIELTVRNAAYFLDHISDPRKAIVVVQGYHPHEYRYCAERLRELGLVTAVTGIGSLCIRKYSKEQRQEVPKILAEIRSVLPSWVKLHAFGLNVKFLKHREVVQYINSSDTAAWMLPYGKFNRLRLYDPFACSMKEIDLGEATRRFRKIKLSLETIYLYHMLSYVLLLKQLKLL